MTEHNPLIRGKIYVADDQIVLLTRDPRVMSAAFADLTSSGALLLTTFDGRELNVAPQNQIVTNELAAARAPMALVVHTTGDGASQGREVSFTHHPARDIPKGDVEQRALNALYEGTTEYGLEIGEALGLTDQPAFQRYLALEQAAAAAASGELDAGVEDDAVADADANGPAPEMRPR